MEHTHCAFLVSLCARFLRPGAVRRTLLAAARPGRAAAGPRGKGRAAAQPGPRRGRGGDAVRHGLPGTPQVRHRHRASPGAVRLPLPRLDPEETAGPYKVRVLHTAESAPEGCSTEKRRLLKGRP